ncbi:MAG: hypothetical protein Q9170_006060 [Blastenia crenularia]
MATRSLWQSSRQVSNPDIHHCNKTLTNDAVCEQKKSVIFSWSRSADEVPPSNFTNGMSWIEGLDRVWVACDRSTARIRKDIDPFAPTMHSPTLVPNETVAHWQFQGYRVDNDPFRLFTEAGLVPIDSDRDVVWITEHGFYRAYRISTLKPDDSVVPNLTVGGDPPMTIWEYFDAIRKPHWLAAAEHQAPVAEPAVPQIIFTTEVTRCPSLQALESCDACIPEPVPEIQIPLMPIKESALIQFIQNPNKPISKESFLRPELDPSFNPSRPHQTVTYLTDLRPSVPLDTHPNQAEVISRNSTTRKRPLPILPPREQRAHTLQSFNENAVATFSELTTKQKFQHAPYQYHSEQIHRGRDVDVRALKAEYYQKKGWT